MSTNNGRYVINDGSKQGDIETELMVNPDGISLFQSDDHVYLDNDMLLKVLECLKECGKIQ